MHSDSRRELHEIAHWRIHESGTGRRNHIDVGVSDHGPATPIDDLSVDAGSVIQIFVGDSIGTGGCKMSIASRANRRFQYRAPVVKQVRLLITKIDFHGVLSERSGGGESGENSRQKNRLHK